MLRDIVWWVHETSGRHDWFSWLWHAIVFLPGIGIIAWQPRAAGYVAWAYREAEQMLFRYANGEPLRVFDSVMDVVAPGTLAWTLLPA